MAMPQALEIQFAQRLACNEKPIRSKAIKKLRNYIIVRSHKSKDGFTSEELLKLWKGLFYCLWMQDKPLLQEELSNQISGLFHCFQYEDGQFLYLEAFLQTVKREWNGIDRLRMDKFYQLVRFIFRQTFEALRKRDWDASLVDRFLEMLTSQVLQGTGTVPSGLQFHILDLYLAELARVGSAELSADQNLTLIIPFCKVVAKTKDHTLFKAICSSIFSTIIDQAPFAIQDLLRELKAAEDSDSGRASQDEDEEEEQMKRKFVGKKSKGKAKGKLLNGTKSKVTDDEAEDQSLGDSDMELLDDGESEPVLQFDYGALADKLFEFASRGNAPSRNRQRLYKIIKILQDLSNGVFPQDGYPEEVSTDEDDEMFGSRSRMKRKGRRHEDEEQQQQQQQEEEEEAPAVKKKKKNGKKLEKLTDGENKQESVGDDGEPTKTKKKKRKKRRRNKAGKEGEEAEVASPPAQMEAKPAVAEDQSEQSPPTGADAAGRSESLAAVDGGSEPLKTIAASEPTGQAGEQVAAATQEEDAIVGPAEPESTPAVKPAAAKQKGRKKSKSLVVEADANEAEATPTPPDEAAADSPTDADATVPAKKTRRRSRKSLTSLCAVEEAPAPTDSTSLDTAAETTPTLDATMEMPAPAKKGQKGSRAAVEVEDLREAVSVATPKKNKIKKTADKREVETLAEDSVVVCKAPQNKKNKKTPKAEEAAAPTDSPSLDTAAETTPTLDATTETPAPAKKGQKGSRAAVEVEDLREAVSVATPKKNKIKKTADKREVETLAEDSVVVCKAPQNKKNKKTPKAEEVAEEAAAPAKAEPGPDQIQSADATASASKKKKKQKKAVVAEKEGVASRETPAVPLAKKKIKRKIPVVFEFEADEVEAAAAAAAALNGLAGEDDALPATPKKSKLQNGAVEMPATPLGSTKAPGKKLLKSPGKKAKSPGKPFISFQAAAAPPTPLFVKTKGTPGTPQSKKPQMPKSEAKKVTFGLKNNKTAEFRKSDRSLLLSAEGPSRVPFDPTQKPKFGVLKSPGGVSPMAFRKMPKPSKKPPTGTPKQRPSAADFF